MSGCPRLFAPGQQAFDQIEEVVSMAKFMKLLTAFTVLLVCLSYIQPASAITAELAKKCRELAIKAHPTPTAGSKTNPFSGSGAAKAQRDYYNACIAKGSNGNTEKEK